MDDGGGVLEVARLVGKYNICWVLALRASTPTYILIVTTASFSASISVGALCCVRVVVRNPRVAPAALVSVVSECYTFCIFKEYSGILP